MEFNITGNVNLDTTQAENKLQSLVGDMSDIPSILGDGKISHKIIFYKMQM